MRLCTFIADGAEVAGLVVGEAVIDLAAARPHLPKTLPAILAAGPDALAEVASAAGAADRRPLQTLRLAAPLGRRVNVFAVGMNYADHARETGRAPSDVPACFTKPPGAIAGPYDAIRRPAAVAALDYEGELAVVIGRTCHAVSAVEAHAFVAGYLVMNDVTARDHLAPDRLVLAKGADTFAPMGPWLVTADEAGGLKGRRIRTWVDDELRQDSSTDEMIVGVGEIIALLSRTLTLQPGDVIATGSPAGSGVGLKPPCYLEPGQIVTVEIEGLGRIRNPVVQAAEQPFHPLGAST